MKTKEQKTEKVKSTKNAKKKIKKDSQRTLRDEVRDLLIELKAVNRKIEHLWQRMEVEEEEKEESKKKECKR